MYDWLPAAIASAVASGLINYGANKIMFAWLRRDIDAAHARLDKINAPYASFGKSEAGTTP